MKRFWSLRTSNIKRDILIKSLRNGNVIFVNPKGTGERDVFQNLTKIPMSDTRLKFNKKLALINIDLSNDIYFVWFRGGPNFVIGFGNDVIMTSFVIVGLSNWHIL